MFFAPAQCVNFSQLRTAKHDISSWAISATARQSMQLERCSTSNYLRIGL